MCECVFGSGGVSARVLLTPQGVKDFWTNTASFKNKLFDFSLLKLFKASDGLKNTEDNVKRVQYETKSINICYIKLLYAHVQF